MELWVEARDGRPAVNPVMAVLLERLADLADVRVRVPEQEPPRDSAAPDLVLLKTVTPLALSLAVAAEGAGGRFLNAAADTVRVADKAAVLGRLAAAGVPVPRTYLHDPAGGPSPAPAALPAGGWVSKPVLGTHGLGVRLHDGWATAVADRGPAGGGAVRLVQQRVGGTESDVKAYAVGGTVFAVDKAFSPTSFSSDEVAARPLDERTAGVVRACGAALGLSVYGVDVRLDGPRPVVIDANPFPGFRGLPQAVPVLLDEVRRVLAGGDR